LVVLSQAAAPASEYPKVVRKNGQICVQVLNPKGAVEESCRAEGSDVRTPLPSQETTPVEPRRMPRESVARPTPSLTPSSPPTPSALYWADTKKNWALAFKIGAVGALMSTLVAAFAALVVSSSNLPHAADPYLATSGVAGGGALLFTVFAVLFDRWGFQELEPNAYAE
jgi:hypothetical protein